MEYIKGIENYKYNTPCAVTVGKLDALHRGHQLLIDSINAKKAIGFKSVVIIFSVSPRLVLNKQESDLKFIITDAERLLMLEDFGVDVVLELAFTDETIRMEAGDFVKMLCDRLNMKFLCVGEDFRFGYRGLGDIGLLDKMSKELSYEFCAVKKVRYKDLEISSTRIRDELRSGNIKDSNEMLGYNYFLSNKITDNKIISPREKILPPNGKYKALIRSDKWGYEGDCLLKHEGNNDYWQLSCERNLGEGDITLSLLDYLGES